MIKPTVGRVVLFWPGSVPVSFRYPDSSQPCAAQIAYVWNDALVNLHVLDQNGCSHNFTSVPLVQEGVPEPAGFFCEWMPYQKAVAAGEIPATKYAT